MKSNWFQMEDVDVFISHSHKDIVKVKAFAGWLYDEFGITAFIDSCVWGYCDELLKQIDERYCKNKKGDTYNYNLRNYTTSHVHMMLSTALTEMIDKTECIMFYNSPNSVSMADDLKKMDKEGKKVTLSPWIYYELAMTKMTRICKPDRDIQVVGNIVKHSAFAEMNTISIEHSVDEYIKELIEIKPYDLERWIKKYEVLTHRIDGDNIRSIKGYENIHPLDVLYSLTVLSE